LTENSIYDKNGQLVTGSFMDYSIPRATDVPSFKVDTRETPCTHNPLGVKGCGEAGAIGTPPTVVNAVLDALNGAGIAVEHIDMPLTPSRVWAAIEGARKPGPQASPQGGTVPGHVSER
jgi:carbon-monoxide dehydrogenase large subunit